MSPEICGRHLPRCSPRLHSCCSSLVATSRTYCSLGLAVDGARSRCAWQSARHVGVSLDCFSWKVFSLASSPDSPARSSPGTLPDSRYPDVAARTRFAEQTLAALRDVPGLGSATISADIPLLAAAGSNFLYARTDGEILPIDKRAAAAAHNIAPEYFKTWGIPLLAGRDFDEHDKPDRQNVIIISVG